MKRITVKKIKEALVELDADEATTELVLSTVEHHNDLVKDYNTGDKHQQYLCYQLKQQLFKMLQDLRKQSMKSGKLEDDEDTFSQMVDAVKQTKSKPIGFKNNSKADDCETR